MIEINFYKLGAIIISVVILSIIDVSLGIDLNRYPWWKRRVHEFTHMAWGAIIVMMIVL